MDVGCPKIADKLISAARNTMQGKRWINKERSVEERNWNAAQRSCRLALKNLLERIAKEAGKSSGAIVKANAMTGEIKIEGRSVGKLELDEDGDPAWNWNEANLEMFGIKPEQIEEEEAALKDN